jgi:hypothetical protein
MKTARMVRLAWVGPLTVATAVLAVVAVQAVAIRALTPLPQFSRAVLASTEPAVATAILVSAGVIVFAMCIAYAAEPLRTYRRIARAALAVSFVPNIVAGFLMRPAVDWPSMIALMSMHVVAWAITVSMLTLSGAGTDLASSDRC